MKEAGRSELSGTIVKKKSSSGCLIIKKKVADGVGVPRGFSDSSSGNLFNSSKEKKRPRAAGSDSEFGDYSSETIRGKVDEFRNGSVGYKGAYLENREFATEKRVSNGLDVFDFDEYDGFDERRVRKDVNDGRYRLKLYRQSGDQMESGNGGSRMMVDNGRDFHYDNKKSSRPSYGATNQFEMEDDESHLPLSVLTRKYRLSSNKPIRLQGKNGVLKVMVNKNKPTGFSCRSYDHAEADDPKETKPGVPGKKKLNLSGKSSDHRDAGDGQSSRSEDANKKKAVMKSSFYSNFKIRGKSAVSKSKEDGELKFQKPLSRKNSKEPNDSETPMQFKSYSRGKMVKNEEALDNSAENVTRVKGKENKVKRGSGTEKQLLREKIKNMLLAAGWTIDYRPRRNRDYLDAVYINPAGTAYWSIIKAYDALQKEEEDNCKAGGNFTPLPDEILGKLTRQTRKKIEREMKKKRKNEGNNRNAKRARVKEAAEDADSDQQTEKLNSYMKHVRKSKKSRLEEARQDSGDDSSDNSYKGIPKYDRVARKTGGTSSHMVHGREGRKIGRCTLLVRSSDEGPNSENDGFVPYSGKRTLLSWLIDSGTVDMSEQVQYMNRRKTRVMQKGWITRDGIHCGCCSKILTVSKFELHAESKLRQPFPNLFLQSGKSLMQCQIDAWNKQGESERKGFYSVDVDGDDHNDDTCGICGDGGDLICCDGCPSTFHQGCLDIQMLPQGDWHCPNCSCKYCEIASGNCTEVSGKTETSLPMCCLCEKKYHESCKPEIDIKPIDSNYPNLSFCGQKCQKLYGHLQKLLGVKHELDSGFSWSLIHRSDLLSDGSSIELAQRVECNSMLAVAMSVMDECFLPIADRRSGINLIRNVVFNCGSNLTRLNYNGFFTAILERGDEVLCAASIRIHGTQLAEMPFIGTRHMYRRQGMCRRLLSAIESALSSLQVEKLIIPAIAEHMHTWTDVFGFQSLEESHKQELRSMNMLVFPGTDMLQKPLVKQGIPNAIPEGKALLKRSELNFSDVKEFSDKIATTDFDSQEPSVPSDDGCSVDTCKETLPINSPVKDEMLVPGSANKSESVSGSSGGLDPNAGDGDTSKTANADSLLSGVPDVSLYETVSSDIPCEPKLQLSGNEFVPFDSHSNPNVEEISAQNGNGTNLLPSQVLDPSHDTVPSGIPCEHLLQGKGSASSADVHTVSMVQEIDVQNGSETTNNTNVISLQVHAPNVRSNNTLSSDTLGEHELQSLDACVAMRVEKSSADVSPVILETGTHAFKDNIQFSRGDEGSRESEMNSLEKEKGLPGAVSESDIKSHSEVGNDESEVGNDESGLH